MKLHGTRLLACQNQHKCYTKWIVNKVANFYHGNKGLHKSRTPMKHVESNVQSLMDLCVDTMPHQMKGI